MDTQDFDVYADRRMPGFLPILMFSSGGSIVASLFWSNYFGMALAALTVVIAVFALRESTRPAWNWVMGLSAIGFFLGLAALVMRIVIDAQV